MSSFTEKIRKHPYYLFLFPVFFVFHGFTANFYFVSVKSALLLVSIYLLASLLLTGLFYLFSRRLLSAAIMATFVMAINFFFGNIYDFIQSTTSNPLFTKYSFLAILFLILVLLLFFLLRKKQLTKLTSYLNIVFILLLVIEIFSLGSQAIFKKKAAPESFAGFTSICDTCQKPDIYIILLDGYAGAEQLNDIFHYDNSPFSDSLKLRGFKVVKKSNSNYDSSPSSVASTLNMEYLDSAEVENMRKNGHRDAFTRINNNRLMSFLQANGYDVFNYSIFKVAGQAAPIGGAFVPANTRLVNGNTLVSRLEKDVFLNLATRFHLDSYVKKQLYAANRDNERLYSLTQKNVMTRSSRPKIIYTHLMMPHHPYYYDENGKARPFEELNNMPLNDTVAYLSYLKYTNKKILELVDHILSNSPSPPVITVMSDHGFRYFNGEYNKYAFSDFLSIHTPGRNYDQFSDTMTNVNFFSRLLNNSFQQQLPLQIDTSFKVDF